MPVLVEAISVIVKCDAVRDRYPGGWPAFFGSVPNQTFCTDGELARVGFMSPADVEAYVDTLRANGLGFLPRGDAMSDIAVVDQLTGPIQAIEWLEFGRAELNEQHQIAVARKTGSGLSTIQYPRNWQFDRSLSKNSVFVKTGDVPDKLDFVRTDGGVDVYKDRATAELSYVGRAVAGQASSTIATTEPNPSIDTAKPVTAPAVSLDIDKIGISFGGLKAVQSFSLKVPCGALYGLIGPNGAGKTTIFNLITGVYRPNTGTVALDGRRVDGKRPHQIAQAGLSRTFQNIRLFGELSVLDNVRLGAQMRHSDGVFRTTGRSRLHIANERAIERASFELLEIFKLRALNNEQARNLSYGDQRRLEIARALATQPKILLLDEPAAGMNPQEKIALMDLIRFIRDRFGVGILLIEHDMKLVMNICEQITVVDHGETIAVGTPSQIQANPKVIEAYLGEPG